MELWLNIGIESKNELKMKFCIRKTLFHFFNSLLRLLFPILLNLKTYSFKAGWKWVFYSYMALNTRLWTYTFINSLILYRESQKSHPHLLPLLNFFEEIKMCNWASGHVYMIKGRECWCITIFPTFPQKSWLGGGGQKSSMPTPIESYLIF